MSPSGAHSVCSDRNMCSADQLIISCCYLLFTYQLKMNPYVIPFICELFVAIITYMIYQVLAQNVCCYVTS